MVLKHEANALVTEFTQCLVLHAIDCLAIEQITPFVGRKQCAHDVEQSGFAGTRHTRHGHEITMSHLKAYPVEHHPLMPDSVIV